MTLAHIAKLEAPAALRYDDSRLGKLGAN